MSKPRKIWEWILNQLPTIKSKIKNFETQTILNDILRDKDTDEAIILFQEIQELFKIEMERRYDESEKEMQAITKFYFPATLEAI